MKLIGTALSNSVDFIFVSWKGLTVDVLFAAGADVVPVVACAATAISSGVALLENIIMEINNEHDLLLFSLEMCMRCVRLSLLN